jgi:beta-phosphoglucomutase-like phosphatase (HAD superfamily)
MPFEAVIFDCDGTLVDSVGLAAAVLVEQLMELGFTISKAEAAARFGAGRLAVSIAEFNPPMRRA